MIRKITVLAPILAISCLAASAGPALAKGCIKGAMAGGLLGHMAGHHGKAGAAVGCVAGHHHASMKAKRAM
ncbi:MAG: hypothetical protein M3N34_01025 [Pseudomonadota bacterium]|nr:hypothetical protein [Pseudomonadota bacterium]